MLDIKLIADSPQAVKDALNNRCDPALIDEVVTLNNRRKEILGQVESMKATRNSVSGRIATLKREKKPCDDLIAEMKDLGDNIKIFDDEMQSLEPVLRECLLKIPNIPDATVPSGKDESDNQEVRRYSAPRMFDFQPKPHWEIGESLGILDAAAAGKITGARFTVYRGDGARLERAVINFMLNCHGERGYTEILPPFLVNRDSMYGTGQLPKFEEDAFSVAGTSYFLVPTAEVPVTNLYRGDTLGVDALPIRMCAYTACFRAEAGSAGRDTRGLIRQHQFNKVELVKLCHPEKSDGELEGLTGDAEAILQQLGLPYRVEVLCSGDTGFGSAKTYDLEVWMPSYNKYVEISSCSNYKDFQARRMNIKYKDGSQSGFVHTLNGSGLAVGRTVAAILENYQNADGSVTIPDALVPFFGKKFIGKDC